MKILFDHQIFTNQQFGGISRYFFELLKRLDGKPNMFKVGTYFSNNAYYNKSFNPELSSFLSKYNFRGKYRLTKYVNQKYSTISIKSSEYDIFHPTYYDPYFLKYINNKPFVVTFHDMIHEKFSNKFSELKSDTTIYDNKKRLLEESSKVIAISETTKNDIINIFGIDKEKIEVIYHGNSLSNRFVIKNRIIDEDYILFVGNRGSYKNFVFLVTAIVDLLIKNNLTLICAGGGTFTNHEISILQSLKIHNKVIFKQILNDDILTNYYEHALFFCFPSLYEGFGIPVLESFACECPVLLSNGGALPEIGADGALYFDPTDLNSLYTQALNLLSDETLRKKLIEKGNSQVRKFSWDKTYQNHLKVYESVIK